MSALLGTPVNRGPYAVAGILPSCTTNGYPSIAPYELLKTDAADLVSPSATTGNSLCSAIMAMDQD
jgi:hypothetical protein